MSETVTLIGFGEAGQSIAKGLVAEAGATVRAFDLRFAGAGGAALREKADALGVAAFDELAPAVAGAGIVLSLVVGSAALAVGRTAAAHLKPGQIFVDLNSVSPGTKHAVGAAVAPSGADFVEAAVMARVPPAGHKVPLLLAGAKAEALARRLGALGMVTEVAGDAPGQASLTKMLRSVVIKGTEALLIEALTAARRYGVEDRLLDSLKANFLDVDWRSVATYYLGRTAIHGARRVTEMTEAAETLKEIGIAPIMTEAATQRIAGAYARLKDATWPDGGPMSYGEILDALQTTATASDRRVRA